MSLNYTSLVLNSFSKKRGVPEYYYRWRWQNERLKGTSPATRYQIQKNIQKTVGVYQSQYADNLKALSAYVPATKQYYGVCWNQQSDRPIPSVQKATVPTGFFNSLNNRRFSVTSGKPGSQTPGGVGCDIKHNSYARYLNRLKGKSPYRNQKVPEIMELPEVKFNPAFPVYGSKFSKTNIVAGCNCPLGSKPKQILSNGECITKKLYDLSDYQFRVGQYINFRYYNEGELLLGHIVDIIGNDMRIKVFNSNKIYTGVNINNSAVIPIFKSCIVDLCNVNVNDEFDISEEELYLG